MVKEKLVLYYYPSSRCTESQCVLLLCLCLSILSVIFKIEGPDPGVLLSGGISPVLWNISTEALFRGPDPARQKEKYWDSLWQKSRSPRPGFVTSLTYSCRTQSLECLKWLLNSLLLRNKSWVSYWDHFCLASYLQMHQTHTDKTYKTWKLLL